MLISCPECRKSISDTKKRCPHCGYLLDINHKRVSAKYNILHYIVIILSLTMTLFYYSPWIFNDAHGKLSLYIIAVL